MSEHRRKPPQGRGRRAAQPPSGRRAAPPRGETTGSYGSYSRGPEPPEPQYGSRAEARRAAQRGGRRRAAGAAGMEGAAGRGRGRGHQPPAKKRFLDYPRTGKYGWRRWMPSWKQTLGTFVGFCALMLGLAGVAYAMVDIPDENPIAQSQKNVYYWADGSRMVSSGKGQNRQKVEIGKISKHMQNAVIAAENESFYSDSGIDPKGIARAVVNMAMGGETQSGSTITQQYVKNLYLSQDQTLSRKVKEMVISVKVGTQQDKDEILKGYLNTSYYGRGAYGIQAAARAYYDKDAADLSLSQSAFLAATVNGPNLYDPYGGEGGGPSQSREANTKRATKRWKWILERESAVGQKPDHHGSWATPAQVRKAIDDGFPQPKKPEKSTNLKGQIGYMVRLANKDILNSDTGISRDELLKQGGLQIYTTFEKDKVKKMEDTVKAAKKKSLDPEHREQDKYVQFGGASVKPGDGAITAIYGGESATEHWMNNADYTGASVGSTFKPFVLAAALTHGIRAPKGSENQPDSERIPVTQKTVYPGDSGLKVLQWNGEPWMNSKGKEWLQPNEQDKSYGPLTLRKALEISANTPYVQLGMDVGLDKVKQAALGAGIQESSMPKSLTPTFSIGVSAPSAIRMANAYATFDNHGVETEPYSVKKVKQQGEVRYTHDKKSKQAVDPNVADTITDMLVNVVRGPEGTGSKAAAVGRDTAGKTGTTDDNKQAWFTGYTPKLATSIGMWRMNDNPKKGEKTGFTSMKGVAGLPQIFGASFPEEIWTAYMKKALEGVPPGHFTKPQPIDGKKYCAHKACPSTSPSPSPSPSDEPSTSPSPTQSGPTSPTPDPSDTCRFVWSCQDGGQDSGQTGGGQTGGGPGGPSSSTTPSTGTNGGTGGNGNNGGIFGGPTGPARTPQ